MKFLKVTFAVMLVVVLCSCDAAHKPINADKSGSIKYVAFTFDDGPYTPVTDRIVDTLEKYNARATFFVVGNRAEVYSKSVKKAYSIGCEIGNHTYSHADLCGADKSTVEKEIGKCSDVILKITGEREQLFRPTGGKNNKTLQSEAGRALILWNIDTRDWAHHSSEKTIQIIKENISDGSIILMHDLEKSTAESCEKLIPELVRQGYQLVTVSELLRINGIKAEAGVKYYSAV
ncbi:MAG: polysaccharide deacetylase family protein [Clostridia bacterium]|nr:polysaccharide deacetylase family protein [Clostridia bacterium]